jgi:hypothetical protein
MGKLVKFRERKLLMFSKIIEDYPLLIEFLETESNMDESELETLPHEMQLFFRNIYKKVLKQAVAEWTADTQHPIDILDDDKKIRCQLCNHKIKYVCYIINKLNNNRLEIGTECVKHFGMNLDVPIEKLFREMIKTKRLEELNKFIPNIEIIISNWKEEIDSFPVLIPLNIKKPYLELGNEANELFQEYLNPNNSISKNTKKEFFNEIKSILKQRKEMLKEINEYVLKNVNGPYVPKKEIIDWLKRNNRTQALTWLEEDGKIKLRTIFRIEEPNFMKFLIGELNNHLLPIGINVEGIDEDYKGSGYVFVSQKNPRIKLFCRHYDFMIEYGGLIIGEKIEKELNLKEILKISSVYKEDSIDAAIDALAYLAKRSNIEFKEHYYDFDDVIVFERSSNKYIIIKLSRLIENFIDLVFGVGDKTANDLVDYIMSYCQRYDYDYIKELRRNRSNLY